jgi:hypothetical protein
MPCATGALPGGAAADTRARLTEIRALAATARDSQEVAWQAQWIEDVEAGRAMHRHGPPWSLGEAGAAARDADGVPWQVREARSPSLP